MSELTEPSLIQLAYVSSASRLFDEQTLRDILTTARSENPKHSITGMLLYSEGNILQVIEGPSAAINQLIENIKNDTRHSGLIELYKEPISQRHFPSWSMACRELPASETDGISDLLHYPFQEQEFKVIESKARKLLLSFCQQR